MNVSPSYIKLHNSGELTKRIEKLYKILESCQLCPRKCKVNRLNGELGFCRSGKDLIISSFYQHFGEEKELVGQYGSGAVFLTNCNLGCAYCQNYEVSHLGEGEKSSKEDLVRQMIHLKTLGCHNINFVTPTHFIPQIVEAVDLAAKEGLDLPLVFNCGGYENAEVIKMLEGIFDIYMPDIKYADAVNAKKYSNAEDYFQRLKESVKEMHRQVGDLEIKDGIAVKGLLIRHLVLPNDIAGSKKILEFIAKEISKDSYVNIMDQYRPCYKAVN
ncbi:MAG: radical SAM protein, partial [Candidatus Omnitrophica bacterium]|nr:radical SAM protein [Candidatus Omnitrophota bacterium]